MSKFRPDPPTQCEGWSTGQWTAWLTAFTVIKTVRAFDRPLCMRCRRPMAVDDQGSSWPTCWACSKVYGGTAAAVVPISYAASNGLTSLIAQAKDEPDRWWIRYALASLMCDFLTLHRPCLERQAGGPFTIATTVPSHPSKRAGRDHLSELVGTVNNMAHLPWRYDVLTKLKADTAGERRQRIDCDLFSAPHDLRGQTILLIDDLYTSGSTSAAAATALIAAGASPPVILTIGRHLDPATDEPARAFIDAARLNDRSWEPNNCAAHIGSLAKPNPNGF